MTRGDHTSVDLSLLVLPPKTETVIFSIDGSFTASVSIMGRDPKVRAAAVDVVRSALSAVVISFSLSLCVCVCVVTVRA